ncbi:LOW QUALITY PROTEIN: uncharacterized protein LOC143257500 [Tachypleus tridentatus]|uniref:LOW QUALITY PROTEIN: uncharacterized protein LOC143257500 n=1 Tax=Tachypleus tridentatus TaxID=6853 RepID=UPI003FD37A50
MNSITSTPYERHSADADLCSSSSVREKQKKQGAPRDKGENSDRKRIQCHQKVEQAANEIKSEHERSSDIVRQRDILVKHFEKELQRLMREKEEGIRKAQSETRRLREELTAQVRDAERRAGHRAQDGANQGDTKRLIQEVYDLREVKRRLEENLKDAMEADRRKASDLRRVHEKYDSKMRKIRKESEGEVRKLLREVRAKDRTIHQLEKELNLQCGQRIFEKNEPVEQLLQLLKEASNDSNCSYRGNAYEENVNSVTAVHAQLLSNPKAFPVVRRGKNVTLTQEQKSTTSKDSTPKPKSPGPKKSTTDTMYKRLYSEHLQLQRAFSLLRHLVAENQGIQGTTKILSWAEEKQTLENKADGLNRKVTQLCEELKEAKDQNELLEFRVLELEQANKIIENRPLSEKGVNTESSGENMEKIIQCGSGSYFDDVIKKYKEIEIKAEAFNGLSEKLKSVYYKGVLSSDERSVLAQTIGFLETCHTHMKETVAALEEKINNLEGEKKQMLTFRPPEDLVEDYERCKMQLEETQKILASTQEELEEVQKREATLNQMEEMNQQCMGHLRNAFKDLQSQLAVATRGQDAQAILLKEHIEHINSLKAQLENIEEERKRHQEEVQHLMKENKSLKETLAKLNECSLSETDGQEIRLPVLPGSQDLASREIQDEMLQEKLRDVCKSCDDLRQVINDYERINNELSGRLAIVEKSEQELVEKNLRLYIDYVSAREDIQKLFYNLTIGHLVLRVSMLVPVKVYIHDVFPDEPDSMGTATSEDEGLGDDSRRGDSTGPSSLTDLHESEDLLTKSSDFNFGEDRVLEHSKPQGFEQIRSKFQEMDNLQQKREESSDCRKHSDTLVVELQEKLKVKEAQICKLLSEHSTASQSKSEEMKKWQLEMEKQQEKFEDQQKYLLAIEKEKKELQEKLLELEESENDARCGEQKLQEQLKNLLEKQKELEEESSDRNRYSEVFLKQLMVAEATENELRSQITYMETLVQKYEVHIQDLESSETELQKKVFRLEQMLQPNTLMHYCECSENTDSSKILDTVNSQKLTSSESCSDEVKVDIGTKSMSDQSTQTLLKYFQTGSDACSHDLGENSLYTLKSVLSHPSLCASSEVLSEKQQALLVRLRALEEEDSVLREQLHQMDGLNLVLWQKLYDLGNHVGACKRENVSWEISLHEDKHYKATARLDDLLTAKNADKEMQSSLPVQSEATTTGQLEHRQEHILSRLLSLEGNEQKLKERLWELEKINHEFEKELEIREKLYKEKDKQQQKWMQEERFLKETIQTLNGEKSLLFQKVSLLNLEKKNLEKEVENVQKTLETLKLEHAKEMEDLERRHSEEVANLRTNIKYLENTIEKMTKQINLCPQKEERVNNELIRKTFDEGVCVSSLQDFETQQDGQKDLDEKVEQNKKQLESLKEMHKSEIELMKSQHFLKESTLEEDMKKLRLQQQNRDEEIAQLYEKMSKLEKDLETKQNELEICNQQYKNSMRVLEEENHLVEAELKWKLKEMEENTAATVTALKEEKQKLELNLQTDLEDLHSKEKIYKVRISELEKQVQKLKSEIGSITVSSVVTSEMNIKEECEQLDYISEREKLLHQKLEEMEKKEAAYRETLENADKIVASLEGGYKEKIDELESSERNLKLRVSHLEDIESRLRNALKYEQRGTDGRKSSDLLEELMEAESRESELKEKVCELENTERNLLVKIKGMAKSQEALKDELKEKDDMTQNLEKLRQETEDLKKELVRIHRSENALKETLEEADTILLQRESELNQKIMELEEEKKELEDTVIQLRNDVRQLKDRIERDINKQITVSCEPFSLFDFQCEETPPPLPARNDETFYACDRQNWKIREHEYVEADLRLEITRLRQCLSASNSHLADLDSVRRNQEDAIASLQQDKTMLQEELRQLKAGVERSQGLYDRINQLQEEKKQLLQRIEKIDIEEKWRESLIKVNAQLQEQVELLQEQLLNLQGQDDNDKVFEVIEPELLQEQLIDLQDQTLDTDSDVVSMDDHCDDTKIPGRKTRNQESQTDDAEFEQRLQLLEQERIIEQLQIRNRELEAKETVKLLESAQGATGSSFTSKDIYLKPCSQDHSTRTINETPISATNSSLEPSVAKVVETTETSTIVQNSLEKDSTDVTSNQIVVSDEEGLDARFQFEECVTRAMLAMEKELEKKEHRDKMNKNDGSCLALFDSSSSNSDTESTVEQNPLSETYYPTPFHPVVDLPLEKSVRGRSTLTSTLSSSFTTKPQSNNCITAREKLVQNLSPSPVSRSFNNHIPDSQLLATSQNNVNSRTFTRNTGARQKTHSQELDVPSTPVDFRILRQVGNDSLLVGWQLPEGGATIGGYQIFVDNELHQKVRSPDRTKALLHKLNLGHPLSVSIRSVSTSNVLSEPVITSFTSCKDINGGQRSSPGPEKHLNL